MVRESAWKRTKAYIRRMRANKAGGWIALLLLLIIGQEVSADADANATINYRLPTNVIPLSYEIKFIPNIIEKNFTFNGEENVTISILNETSNITLHAHFLLQIDENATKLIASNGTCIKPKTHIRTNITDFLTLTFETTLLPGNYLLHFKFMSSISKETPGIYKSSYINEKNEKVWIIATRPSPTKARGAFPCWDEPALRASFNISIKHYSNYTATSNMPVQSKLEADDEKTWTIFQTTPNISTYLVGFVISDFSCISDPTKTYNFCANEKVLPDMKFAQDVQSKALPALVELTGFASPFKKLDSYAIPETETKSTENWGLSIYRESRIAIKDNMPDSTKEMATELIINELSRQWFGNLVSPTWWKYTWIKEGLSHYMQFYIANKIFPDWDMMRMYVARTIQLNALYVDVSLQYNYLNWEPKSPVDIRTQFFSINYQKGSVIMHMLSNILSEQVFKDGIRLYLEKYQYKTATSDDFWIVMHEANKNINKDSNLDIKDIMRPWVEQNGYPIIKVIRDYETGKAVINQTCNMPTQPSNRWCIPINYATKSNPNFNFTGAMHWLKPQDTNLIIDKLDKDDWIILNLKQSGYYRVDYDDENWQKLILYLKTHNFTQIDVLNRAQLINDLAYLMLNDFRNYTTFLELSQYLAHETDLIPWKIAGNAFKLVKHKIAGYDTHENLKKYVVNLMKKVIEQVGFDDLPTDSYLMKKKRRIIALLACKFGHADCLAAASKKLLAHLENPTSEYIESWISCYGSSGEKIESILAKKIDEGNSMYFSYLGCSTNKTYWKQYIEKSLINSSIPKNNTRVAFAYSAQHSPENWDWTVDYFIKNFDRLSKYFNNTPSASSIMNDFIWTAPTTDRMEKIRGFYEKHETSFVPWVKNTIPVKLKKLEWSEKNAPMINDWLQKHTTSISKTPKA